MMNIFLVVVMNGISVLTAEMSSSEECMMAADEIVTRAEEQGITAEVYCFGVLDTEDEEV